MMDMTDITILLDRSGSMAKMHGGVIEGMNEFISRQQKTPGEAVLSVAQFNAGHMQNWYEVIFSSMPIKHVKLWDDSDFKPEGGTALCDAVGRTINDLGSRLEAMAEYRRPNKVVVLIISDGEENASSYYPRQKISNMIDHQHDKYSWEFVFLGTNQDSFKSGAELSIKRNNTKNYQPTAAGMSAALKVAGACMDTYRTMPQNYTKGNFYNNAAALKSGSTIEDTIPVEPISPTVSLDPSMRSMIAEEDAKVLSAINLANFQGAAGKVDDSMEQLREFLKKKCQPV